MKSYKEWCLFPKIVGLSVTSWLALVAAAMLVLVPYIRGLVMTEKKNTVRFVVEEASTILANYQKQVESGALTKDEAQKRAAADVKQIRYDGKEYIFISDLNNRLVAHPLRPENEGKDMSSFLDADGKPMYVEFSKAAGSEKGAGFVDYRQSKPGESAPQPKLSYVKLFKPWGWVVGTGIYITNVDETMRMVRFAIAAGLLVFLGVSILLTWLSTRTIAGPMREVVEQLKDIAQGEGDLTKRLPDHGKNEVGELCFWFNTFAHKLHGIISQLSGSARILADEARQLQSSSEEMAQSVNSLSSQSISLATAGEEMSATSADIANNCHNAASSAGGASSKAQEGAEVIGRSIAAMQSIAERVKGAADTVATLESRSDQIGAIVGTIEEIADQTNMLALNAAIEAARAGEQGRGFAVVADEVRALAERTTRATREIGEMIQAIQRETKQAVQSMKSSVAQVEEGRGHAAASGETLEEMLEIVNGVADQISQIATAAEEQTAITREISHNVMNLNELAHNNSAAIEESSTAAAGVSQQAEGLQALVSQFRL